MTPQQTALFERARSCEWPPVVLSGQGLDGEEAWRHAIARNLSGELLQLEYQLIGAEERKARRERLEAEERARAREYRARPPIQTGWVRRNPRQP